MKTLAILIRVHGTCARFFQLEVLAGQSGSRVNGHRMETASENSAQSCPNRAQTNRRKSFNHMLLKIEHKLKLCSKRALAGACSPVLNPNSGLVVESIGQSITRQNPRKGAWHLTTESLFWIEFVAWGARPPPSQWWLDRCWAVSVSDSTESVCTFPPAGIRFWKTVIQMLQPTG